MFDRIFVKELTTNLFRLNSRLKKERLFERRITHHRINYYPADSVVCSVNTA